MRWNHEFINWFEPCYNLPTNMRRSILILSVLLLLAPKAWGQITSFSWVDRQGAGNTDGTYAVAADGNGYTYICGTFSGMVNFGGVTLTSTGTSDAFVAKCTPLGVLVWAKKLGSINAATATAVTIDAKRNVYITGFTNDTAISPPSTNVNRVFIARYDSNGVQQWLIKCKGRGNASGNALALSPSGSSLYITGSVIDSMNMGGLGLTPSTYSSIFLARIDQSGTQSGTVLWLKKSASGSYSATTDAGRSICVDGKENVYVAGTYLDTINFGGIRLPGSRVAPGSAVIVSYDSASKVRWVRNYSALGSVASSICYAEGAFYATGPLVIAMKFEADASVDKVLTNNGNTLGSQIVATDGAGGVFVAGPLTTSMDIGSVKLVNFSASLYFLKLDTSLTGQWVTNTTQGTITNIGLAADTSGHRFISGTFLDSIRLGGLVIGTSSSKPDGFLTMLTERSVALVLPPPPPLCPGDTLMVRVQATGQFFPTNVFKVQLSDSLGNFAKATEIGSQPNQSSCVIPCMIPLKAHSGTKYRILVTASSPIFTTSNNGSNLIINPAPPAAVSPSGSIDLCEQDSLVVRASGGSSYLWSDGDTSATKVIRQSGNYSVYVSGGGGCTVHLGGVQVAMRLLPPVPGIIRNGNVLTSSASANNQWSRNGSPIPGATGTSYTVTQSGTYTVTVSDQYHCQSTSDDYVVNLGGGVAGSNRESDLALSVTNSELLHIQAPVGGVAHLQILDLLGREVIQSELDLSDQTDVVHLADFLRSASTGVYYVRVQTGDAVATIKLIHSR